MPSSKTAARNNNVMLNVGTRGSRLAIAQTQIALQSLRHAAPHSDFRVIEIHTTGDIDRRPLFTMDEKGIFEKEVNEAVLDGKVDFAVHSLKDIPSDLNSNLVVASIPRRASPNDVLISKGKRLAELKTDSIVGSSSLRRAVQIKLMRPDLIVKPIRGNVETRVKKVMSGEYDAIVLAEAGLSRIGMKDVIVERFSTSKFLPAPGQGAIALVCRRSDRKIISFLRSIEDQKSRREILAERALIREVEGGCRFPLGAVARSSRDGTNISLSAVVFSADGSESIRIREKGAASHAERLGARSAGKLIKAGALELAKGWRKAIEDWNNSGGTGD